MDQLSEHREDRDHREECDVHQVPDSVRDQVEPGRRNLGVTRDHLYDVESDERTRDLTPHHIGRIGPVVGFLPLRVFRFFKRFSTDCVILLNIEP